jgi:hypothetical protein
MIAIKSKKRLALGLLLLAPLSLILVLNGGQVQVQSTTVPKLQEVPASAWKNLAQKRIWFGHQSVGYNIVEGMQEVLAENSHVQLNIINSNQPQTIKTPGFVHFEVGNNTDPKGKINDFFTRLGAAKTAKPDIAFFKFCYVDVASYTPDVSQLFNDYKAAMTKLSKAHPETTFIPVTVPLTTEPGGLEGLTSKAKNWVRTIAKGQGELSDNLARSKFNDLLRKEYAGKVPIFDLAKAESTTPDGKLQVFSQGGQRYFTLVPTYTDDGGHLNSIGRKVVAEQLLIFLAKL